MGSATTQQTLKTTDDAMASSPVELQTIPPIHQPTTKSSSGARDNNGNDGDSDVEMRPGLLQQQHAVGVVPSVWDPYLNRFRFVATCVSTVADALSDGAAGALIPYIEK